MRLNTYPLWSPVFSAKVALVTVLLKITLALIRLASEGSSTGLSVHHIPALFYSRENIVYLFLSFHLSFITFYWLVWHRALFLGWLSLRNNHKFILNPTNELLIDCIILSKFFIASKQAYPQLERPGSLRNHLGTQRSSNHLVYMKYVELPGRFGGKVFLMLQRFPVT